MDEKREKVERIVCDYFGITQEQLRGDDRSRTCSDARHFLWYTLSYVFGIKVPAIVTEYGASRRNVYYGISVVYDGVRMQSYYSDIMKAINRRMEEEGILEG